VDPLDEKHRLVFVGGLHKSGTTLLADLLSGHPSISGLSAMGVPKNEGQHTQDVLPTARAHGGPGKFAFDPAAHVTEVSPLATSASARRLMDAWRPHWDLARPVLLEKSPPNLIRTRFLQALFPDASFVIILRHPIAVALATQKWSRSTIGELLHHWIVAHDILATDMAALHRVQVVTFERLTADPQACLDGIHRFLELDSQRVTVVPDGGTNETYFRRWRGLIPIHRAVVRARYEAGVLPFGYSLSDLALQPPVARPQRLPDSGASPLAGTAQVRTSNDGIGDPLRGTVAQPPALVPGPDRGKHEAAHEPRIIG